MSLNNVSVGGVMEDVDPGYIDDASMESLCGAIMTESLNPDEIEQFVTESPDYDIVTEKNIVKLDKNAKFTRAYKVGVLQCGAEDNRKEYQKLRKLWKMEAALFKKLEKQYKNKALAKAREATRKMKRSNSPVAKTAGTRASKSLTNKSGTNKLLGGGIPKRGKK